MKFRIKAFLIVIISSCFFISVASGAAYSKKTQHHVKGKAYKVLSAHTTHQVANFSSIDIAGPFQVSIGKGPQAKVELSGNPLAVHQTSVAVIKGRLVIKELPILNEEGKLVPPPGRVNVKISAANTLARISASGSTVIRAGNISASNLVIVARDQSSIYLSGSISAQNIQNLGRGKIHVSGLNCKGLVISCQSFGYIHVSGSVYVLTARVGGTACLDASNLRSHIVYVWAQDQATALVFPSYALYAFAIDWGDVYYYKKPVILSGYSKNSGDVLEVANRS